jgi:hypothetical protein
MALEAGKKVLAEDYKTLRSKLDTFRSSNNFSALTWKNSVSAGVPAKADAVTELETNINNLASLIITASCNSYCNNKASDYSSANSSQKTSNKTHTTYTSDCNNKGHYTHDSSDYA